MDIRARFGLYFFQWIKKIQNHKTHVAHSQRKCWKRNLKWIPNVICFLKIQRALLIPQWRNLLFYWQMCITSLHLETWLNADVSLAGKLHIVQLCHCVIHCVYFQNCLCKPRGSLKVTGLLLSPPLWPLSAVLSDYVHSTLDRHSPSPLCVIFLPTSILPPRPPCCHCSSSFIQQLLSLNITVRSVAAHWLR